MFNQQDLQHHTFASQLDGDHLLTTRLAYDAAGNTAYFGLAAPGAGENEAVWLLRQLVYDPNNALIAILFANGQANFDQIWNQREEVTFQ